MKFKEFSEYLEKIENLSSRNEITVVLAELVSRLGPEEVREAMYFLNGKLVAKHESLEFSFSTKLAINALQTLFDESIAGLYAQKGDIGLVMEGLFEQNKGTGLSVVEVHSLLSGIARTGGSGSQMLKAERFLELVKQVSSIEAKFIGRIIVGKLRLGVSEKTVLDSLSWYVGEDKSLRKALDHAYGVRSDIGEVAEVIKQTSKDKVEKELLSLQLKPGTPVASKLVQREKDVQAIFARMPKSIVQIKLDGLRAQIHMWKDVGGDKRVEIYSRNMERLTDMFPDVIEHTKRLPAESLIIDSELIGFDPQTGKHLVFQETSQRRRKHGVDEKVLEIPVKAMTFDLLYLNGEDLLGTNVELRIEKLKKLIQKAGDKIFIELLETVEIDDIDDLNSFFETQLNAGHEGVIVKRFGTFYEPGTRNYDWIKLKGSSKIDLVDTIDAVVMGYYFGTGVRSKFGLGAILVGIYSETEGKYKTVAKVGTGITDEQFVTIKNDLVDITLKNEPKNYEIDRNLKPDVYVKPEIVVEIEADEITRSKMHTACRNKEGKGLSLRFPRLKKWNRKDKDPEGATSEKELEQMSKL